MGNKSLKQEIDENLDKTVNKITQRVVYSRDDEMLEVIFSKNKFNIITHIDVYHPIHGYNHINMLQPETYSDLNQTQLQLLHIIINDNDPMRELHTLPTHKRRKFIYTSYTNPECKEEHRNILNIHERNNVLIPYYIEIMENKITYLEENND